MANNESQMTAVQQRQATPDSGAAKTRDTSAVRAGEGSQKVRRRRKKSVTSSLVRNGWLTRQHGGWPMATVPVIAGSALGGFSWSQLLLGVSWLIAFLWFDTLTTWMKSAVRTNGAGKRQVNLSRGRRYVPALITYALIAGVGALALVILHPRVLLWGLVILPLFSIAWWEMWRGEYQSFLARAAAILASTLLLPIAYELGTHPNNWVRAWVATAFVTAYFVGTVPYVKTLIRERGNPGWLRFSLGYHVAMTVITAIAWGFGLATWWMTAAWVILTVRAWVYPEISRRRGKPLRPAVIGVSELAFTAIVLIAVLAN